jgi:flavin-dependent dehydrogenase
VASEISHDVLVAGGGPVGLYAAIEAARGGLRVAVLEARPGILDKACGEGLMPAAVAALEGAGVRVESGRKFHGIRYVEANRRAEGRFAAGSGLGIRRLELHRALAARARELGIEVITHRVRDVEQTKDEVIVDGRRARYLLACDGLRSGIRRRLGLELPARRARRYGLRQHFRVEAWTDLVEVHWHALGEAYVTPVADDEVGIAMLFDDRTLAAGDATMPELLARFPELAARIAGAAPCSSARGAGPFEQRSRHVADGRVLLVGDAAGYLDPITGEGLRLGFCAATAAIDAVRRDDAPSYEKAWNGLVRGYWWSTSALLALRRSPLRPLMIPILQGVPGMFGRILDGLGGTAHALDLEAGTTQVAMAHEMNATSRRR